MFYLSGTVRHREGEDCWCHHSASKLLPWNPVGNTAEGLLIFIYSQCLECTSHVRARDMKTDSM